MTMAETIKYKDEIIAIIIRDDHRSNGVTFFTPDDFSQQLAHMHHPKGKSIPPHKHNSLQREVVNTQEVLFLKKGRLRVDFYADNNQYLESRELEAGDVILLASGGHGFEVLEEIEMIEVKQGPYAGDQDKVRFDGVDKTDIQVRS